MSLNTLEHNNQQSNIRNRSEGTVEKIFSETLQAQGFSIRYDPGDQYIAIGCYNGTILTYDIKESISANNLRKNGRKTCMSELITRDLRQVLIKLNRWRPGNSSSKVIGVTNTAGQFQYYHIPSLKILFTIQQQENSLHCCDFSPNGGRFATAGRDCHIRIYDQQTKSISVDLGCAQWHNRGHSNRVFSVKFIDDNTVISGGWDSALHLWDLRQGKSVQSVYGPHVAGDSLDYRNGDIIVGCYSQKQQLQVWDYNKFQLREGYDWLSKEQMQESVAYVYASAFAYVIQYLRNYDSKTILAGACGVDEARVFNRSGMTFFGLNASLKQLSGGCFSVSSSYKRPQFCVSTGKNGFFIYTQTRK